MHVHSAAFGISIAGVVVEIHVYLLNLNWLRSLFFFQTWFSFGSRTHTYQLPAG